MFYCFSFSAYKRYFVKVLIETNVNLSNELILSDVYQGENYIGSRAKCTLHVTQCSLPFNKHQENENHSLNKSDIKVQEISA